MVVRLYPRLPPEWFSKEVVAGVTVWAVLVPESLA